LVQFGLLLAGLGIAGYVHVAWHGFDASRLFARALALACVVACWVRCSVPPLPNICWRSLRAFNRYWKRKRDRWLRDEDGIEFHSMPLEKQPLLKMV
jgi:hypothetical protein